MSPPDTNANGAVIYSNREQLQEDETKQPIKSSQIKEEEEEVTQPPPPVHTTNIQKPIY